MQLQACGSDVGGKEDRVSPVISLTSLNGGEEVIGEHLITWETDEENRSVVDIHLSSNSGETYDTVIALDVPDDGEYTWDSRAVDDCLTCRLRVTPIDIVGNVGEHAESAGDFVVNNIPEIRGYAYFVDTGADGLGGAEADMLIVPFDKDIDLFSPFASNFRMPVIGDSVGANATVSVGPGENRISILISDMQPVAHLHIRGRYSVDNVYRTASSGVDVFSGLPEGFIVAKDTGVSAKAGTGIDVVSTFTNSGQLLGTSDSTSAALGDVDNDGDYDLVIGNRSGANRVWINNTDTPGQEGVFTDSGQSLGSNDTLAVVLGDIDQDGDLDLIEGNSTAQPNRVWINNITDTPGQEGVFTDSGQSLGSGFTHAIALGDVDDDGDLDIVSGNDEREPNFVWLNNGAGVFSDSGQQLGLNGTLSIQLGDVDNDGDLDIVAGNAEGQSDRLWINDASNDGSKGVFTESDQAFAQDNTTSLALDDIDLDGDIDIVFGTFSGDSRVYLNNINNEPGETGVFTDSGQVLSNDKQRSLLLADVDGDEYPDLITGSDNSRSNRVWINNGMGVFVDTGFLLETEDTEALASADVDNDGDVDFVSANLGGNSVWLNSSKAPGQPLLVDSGQELDKDETYTIAAGDLNGDGTIDLVTGNENGGANVVWLNNLEGTRGQEGVFVEHALLGNSDTRKILLVDVDEDGDIDLISANADQPNRIWLNNDGNVEGMEADFTDSGQELGIANTTTAAAGDVDGDGDVDLVAGNFGAGNKVWLNNIANTQNGRGIFTDSGQDLGANNTFAMALADVDGDGDLDIIEANTSNQANRIWINNISDTPGEEGVFTDSGQALGANRTVSLAAGDVDNDGDIDFVAGNRGANRIWLNNINNTPGQEGVFTDAGTGLGNSDTYGIVLVDIDGDNDLDIVAGNDGANTIWLNNIGNQPGLEGVFTDSGNMLGSYLTRALVEGDVDGDLDTDIVSGNDISEPGVVWLNDF